METIINGIMQQLSQISVRGFDVERVAEAKKGGSANPDRLTERKKQGN